MILRFKGWKPCGRFWAIYPINVTTFRIGPRFLWRFLDRLVPLGADRAGAAAHGGAFAEGRAGGFPVLVWPLPLFVAGILVDNKWIDTVVYRNRAWRRRCDGCELCVSYCPAERLRMVDGYPRASGTCMLCLGCVNMCPRNAMHLLGWTEYGQPYRSRWPDLIVRRKPALRDGPGTPG